MRSLAAHIERVRNSLRSKGRRVPRVLWRTSIAPPDLPGCDCQYPGNLAPFFQRLNAVASDAFLDAGMEVIPMHRWVRTAARWGWWPTTRVPKGSRSMDVHTHELDWCSRHPGAEPAREHGWLSKVFTQLTLATICA